MSKQDRLHPSLSKEIEDWQLEITAVESNPVKIYYDCAACAGPDIADSVAFTISQILGLPIPLQACTCPIEYEIADNGNYYFSCTYYYAYDFDVIHAHERRHCKGYLD